MQQRRIERILKVETDGSIMCSTTRWKAVVITYQVYILLFKETPQNWSRKTFWNWPGNSFLPIFMKVAECSACCCCCCLVASVVSNSVRPHRRQPTRLLCPGDSPGKNIGVGCHFLLQCMKVKSESEVAQSYPTLQDPMDRSPPGSSVHGIFQARVLEWGAIAFSECSA